MGEIRRNILVFATIQRWLAIFVNDGRVLDTTTRPKDLLTGTDSNCRSGDNLLQLLPAFVEREADAAGSHAGI